MDAFKKTGFNCVIAALISLNLLNSSSRAEVTPKKNESIMPEICYFVAVIGGACLISNFATRIIAKKIISNSIEDIGWFDNYSESEAKFKRLVILVEENKHKINNSGFKFIEIFKNRAISILNEFTKRTKKNYFKEKSTELKDESVIQAAFENLIGIASFIEKSKPLIPESWIKVREVFSKCESDTFEMLSAILTKKISNDIEINSKIIENQKNNYNSESFKKIEKKTIKELQGYVINLKDIKEGKITNLNLDEVSLPLNLKEHKDGLEELSRKLNKLLDEIENHNSKVLKDMDPFKQFSHKIKQSLVESKAILENLKTNSSNIPVNTSEINAIKKNMLLQLEEFKTQKDSLHKSAYAVEHSKVPGLNHFEVLTSRIEELEKDIKLIETLSKLRIDNKST